MAERRQLFSLSRFVPRENDYQITLGTKINYQLALCIRYTPYGMPTVTRTSYLRISIIITNVSSRW